MSAFRQLVLTGVILAAACKARQMTSASNISATADLGSALSVAVAGLPVDSLCSGNCSVIVADTIVRRAPTRSRLDILTLPTWGRLPATDVTNWKLENLRVITGAFHLGSAEIDTVRLGLAVVDPSKSGANRATVIATVLLPGTLGVIAVIDLRDEARGWRIVKIQILEA